MVANQYSDFAWRRLEEYVYPILSPINIVFIINKELNND